MFGFHKKPASSNSAVSKPFHLSLPGRFRRNEDGNVAILFLFMSTVLFFFVGGAVDYSRWNAVRADMFQSMDAAGLAMARLAQKDPDITDADLKAYGVKFFHENFNYEQEIEKVAGSDGSLPSNIIDFDLANRAIVGACVTGRLKTYLMGVVGKHYFDIDNCVEITKRGSGKVELALVLDVTGSMNDDEDGNSTSDDTKRKITKLKTAVTTMLDVMYDGDATSENVKIGVVPFNAFVNPGGASSWSSAWEDTNAQAYYHGARFFHVDETGNIDLTKTVNHFDLFNSVPNVNWEGCVEARPFPLDELDVPVGGSISSSDLTTEMQIPAKYIGDTSASGIRNYDAFDDAPSFALSTTELTKSENFRWVPMFYGDEPDCNDTDDCESSGYSESGTTSHGTSWFGYFFDDPDNDGSHASGTIEEGDYNNRHFISDHRYTNYNQSPAFDNYAKHVTYFRNVMGGSVTDTDFVNFLSGIGVTTSNGSHARGRQEYIFRQAYVGWWDSATSTYDYKYDLSPSITSSRGPNRRCPAEILPLTNVRATVETHVNGLSAGGYTNSAHGAIWGWRILSAGAPFTEAIGPADSDFNDWQKAVVIMTDGNNTIENQNTHWDSGFGTNGYAIESRMGANMTSRTNMRNEIDNKLLRVCHRMKEEGYLVYTIMFGLESTSTETVFKACATEPNAPYFYDAATGTQLNEAFGDIAADLVDLHISR